MLGGLFNRTPKKTCPRCGTKFTCAAGDHCWCDEEMHLCRDTIKKLRMQYIDCLCKDCLLHFVAEDKKAGLTA